MISVTCGKYDTNALSIYILFDIGFEQRVLTIGSAPSYACVRNACSTTTMQVDRAVPRTTSGYGYIHT